MFFHITLVYQDFGEGSGVCAVLNLVNAEEGLLLDCRGFETLLV